MARSEGSEKKTWLAQKVIVPGSFRDSRDAILYISYQLRDSTTRDDTYVAMRIPHVEIHSSVHRERNFEKHRDANLVLRVEIVLSLKNKKNK